MKLQTYSFESVEETLDFFIQQHSNRVRSNTLKGYMTLMNHLAAFHPQTTSLYEITPEFCQSFTQYLLGKMQPSSARTYLQKLHTFMQFCVNQGLIKQHPMNSIGKLLPQYTTHERIYLLRHELELLEATPCHHENTRLAFLFACHTGLRLSDIETLRWSDIHENNGRYIVVKMQIKTRHEVRIPLNRHAISILRSIQEQEDFDSKRAIFHLHSRTIIARDLQQWGKDAGVNKNITFHSSRHTFATLMASNQCDIFVVSQLCGHTSIRTTQIYTRLIDEARFHAIDRLDSLFTESSFSENLILRLNKTGIGKRISSNG